jgi:hypothetical protein
LAAWERGEEEQASGFKREKEGERDVYPAIDRFRTEKVGAAGDVGHSISGREITTTSFSNCCEKRESETKREGHTQSHTEKDDQFL